MIHVSIAHSFLALNLSSNVGLAVSAKSCSNSELWCISFNRILVYLNYYSVMCLHVLFSFYISSSCFYSDSTLPVLSLFHPNLWSVRNWDICQRKHCHKEKMLLAAEGLCICPAKFPFKWIFKANHCGFSIATPWDSLNESPPAENLQKRPGNNIAWRSQRGVRVVLSIVSGSDNLDKFWLQFFLENHKNVWKKRENATVDTYVVTLATVG